MKTWQERWLEELDSAVPELREDVKNAPIESVAEPSVREKQMQKLKIGSPKFLRGNGVKLSVQFPSE